MYSVESYETRRPLSREGPGFRLVPHALRKLLPGHDFLLPPAAPAAHGHGPGFGLPLADDGHVRDLLRLRIPDPVTEGLRPIVEAGPQPGLLELVHERLRRFTDRIRDGEHPDLFRGEPDWERARVVLDQASDESLHRAEERPVDHDRAVRTVVGPDVFEAELFGQHEVELERGPLPLAAEGVDEHDVELRAVERAAALVDAVLEAAPFQDSPELLRRLVVDRRVAERLLRTRREEDVVLVAER